MHLQQLPCSRGRWGRHQGGQWGRLRLWRQHFVWGECQTSSPGTHLRTWLQMLCAQQVAAAAYHTHVWGLISLRIHGSIIPAGLSGSYFMSQWSETTQLHRHRANVSLNIRVLTIFTGTTFCWGNSPLKTVSMFCGLSRVDEADESLHIFFQCCRNLWDRDLKTWPWIKWPCLNTAVPFPE